MVFRQSFLSKDQENGDESGGDGAERYWFVELSLTRLSQSARNGKTSCRHKFLSVKSDEFFVFYQMTKIITDEVFTDKVNVNVTLKFPNS